MRSARDMPTWFWKAALAVSAAIWGGSFVVLKGAIEQVSPAWLMAIRFGITTLVLAALFRRRLAGHVDAATLARGAVLGLFYGSGFVVQNVGLLSTTPGRNAFLTAVYCVFTPLINWAVVRRRPGVPTFVAAGLCVVGVGFISLGDDLSFSLGAGEWLSLAAAVLFALHIVFVSRFSENSDVMALTVVQCGTSALFALACAFLFEEPPAPATLVSPDFLASLAYLVVLSSCVAMVVQNVGQSIVEPAQASLILSMESVFAVAFSILFYGEPMTPALVAGFVSIFAAILVSEVVPQLLEQCG